MANTQQSLQNPLVNYLTNQPDKLSLQCLALTKSALDADNPMYREALLLALMEQQIRLADALGALKTSDNSKMNEDNNMSSAIKQANNSGNNINTLTETRLIQTRFHKLLAEKQKQFVIELVKRYLRFMPPNLWIALALKVNHSMEQWITSSSNLNQADSLKQSLKPLFKNYFGVK